RIERIERIEQIEQIEQIERVEQIEQIEQDRDRDRPRSAAESRRVRDTGRGPAAPTRATRGRYSPVKRGGRFSMNAARPSAWSAERPARSCRWASYSSAPSSPRSQA